MANAGININGDGTIHDITSMNGKVEGVTVSRVQDGIYELRGTLGLVPPPYGWGHVTNPIDKITAHIEVGDDVIRLETRNQAGECVDIPSMVAMHIVVADREMEVNPPPEEPQPQRDSAKHYFQLRAVADEQILGLQDLNDIGESTAENRAHLIAWKRYRIALCAVPKQPDWPFDVIWPEVVEYLAG